MFVLKYFSANESASITAVVTNEWSDEVSELKIAIIVSRKLVQERNFQDL